MVSSDELKNKLKKLVLKWVYSKEEMFEKLNNINTSLNAKQSKYTGYANRYKNVVTNSSGEITTEDKPVIPTKTSELINDSNFLTSHQDISGKANISDLSTVAISGSYNDLTDNPTIPVASNTQPLSDTTSGAKGTSIDYARADHIHPKSTLYAQSSHNHTVLTQMTNIQGSFASTQQRSIFNRPQQGQWTFIDNKISYDGTNITYNSSEIATLDDIPTLLSDLTNDSSFIETSNIAGLIKNDGTIDTNTYLTTHQDITGKVNISDIQDNLTSTDSNKPLSAKQGKWLKDNTASASHDHDHISGGMSGVSIFDDTDGVGMYALGDKIIYDWNDSDLVYYDKNGIGIDGDNEIATKGDISDAVGDAITYINQ